MLAAGGVAPLGHSSHILPCWRIRPASRPASSPKPQKKSARIGPRIAPPVSCAITSRCSGASDSGSVVARNTGAPSGIARGSTAIVRPREQRHAEAADRTVDLRLERAGQRRRHFAKEDVARILVEQLPATARDARGPTRECPASTLRPSSVRRGRSARARPSETAGRSGRRSRRASRRLRRAATRPEPWICRKNASTGSVDVHERLAGDVRLAARRCRRAASTERRGGLRVVRARACP